MKIRSDYGARRSPSVIFLCGLLKKSCFREK